jgi:DNA-binding response OmpR family regulator
MAEPVQKISNLVSQPQLDMARVKALVCEPSSLLRQGIRLALNNIGIREVMEASTFLAAHKACEEGDHDFLIINQEIEANDSTYIMRQLRAGHLGRDPFVLSVMLLSSREEPKVRAAMDCGPDDMLLIPFAPDQLMNRLRVLVDRRKPFVVTHDYIGPDRRAQPRPGATSATQFNVPNPARARSQGIAADRYARLRQDTFQAIAVERIKRLAATIEWECNALIVSVRESRHTPETNFRSLMKLDSVSEELSSRIAKTLGHTTDIIDGFLKEVRKMKHNPSIITFSDIEGLSMSGRRIASTYTSR